MTRLILDHYRRWWWVLALVIVFEFRLGQNIASGPSYPFEFFAFMYGIWAGAVLVSFDLRHGLLRSVTSLPLTGGQIGRGWWLATVGIPGIVLSALLFLGAGTFCGFHAGAVFPTGRLILASLFTLVWLGSGYCMIFNAPHFNSSNGRGRSSTFVLSMLSIIVWFGSMLFAQGLSQHPARYGLLLGIGGLLTVVSWVLATQFHPARAGPFNFRPGQAAGASKLGGWAARLDRTPRLTPLAPLEPRMVHAPGGYGGVRFLLSTSFIRMFLYAGAMGALMALLWTARGQAMRPDLGVVMFAGVSSLMSCGFVVLLQLLPVLRQLRYMRTLPISASKLAAGLLAVATLPLLALGAVAAGIAGPTLGTPAATTLLSAYLFSLAPASLCVFFAVWLGEGKPAYALLIASVFGLQQVQLRWQTHLHVLELPLYLAGAFAAGCALLAFLLTRQALLRSSRAYRLRASSDTLSPWGMGK